eukprot:CAMPEP_0197515094 /NCGR_PEP_ID=MMETSP1318-20131121/331_1 /TAXON_ID=552666 /ORGANISM="Partenskyella glossopodia, Strain RCC365" /LENGTH=443 /DNA_ID=CAMNT_0043063369 /DNA_START=9 /DNA_END=1340 /DNA_ORIENTATION=+
MGNCACNQEEDPPVFGNCEKDMEVSTTKHCIQNHSSHKVKRESKKSKKSKAQICAIGTEIYPTHSNHPTPARMAMWTTNYNAAMSQFSKEELDQIAALFREACSSAMESHHLDHRPEHEPTSSNTIGVDEFTKYFSNMFGRVGQNMARQLFREITEDDDKCGKKTLGSDTRLGFRPLVSALHTWQHGTMRDRLVLLFDMWDTSPKDGFLSMNELRNMVRATSRRSTLSTVMMWEALHLNIGEKMEMLDQLEHSETSKSRKQEHEHEHSSTRHPVPADGFAMAKEEKPRETPTTRIAGHTTGAEAAEKKQKDSKRNSKSNDSEKKMQEVEKEIEEEVKDDNNARNTENDGRNADVVIDEINFDSLKPGGGDEKYDYEAAHAKYTTQVCKTIDDELDLFIEQVFEDMDNGHDGLISLNEWLRYASGDRNIDEFLRHFTLQVVYCN